MYSEGGLSTVMMEVGTLCVLMAGTYLEKKQELSAIQLEKALIILVIMLSDFSSNYVLLFFL